MAAKTYPDWVQKFRTKGKTVKKVGDNYYLYKHTSKRVEGKKNPQPVDTYIGVITPDGVIESRKKKMELDRVIVKEFGFTHAILALCPEAWKKAVGDHWPEVLEELIISLSPESYLSDNHKAVDLDQYHVSLPAQKAALFRRLNEIYHVRQDELDTLKSIYVVCFGNTKVLSVTSQAQDELINRLGLTMEVK